MIKTMIVSTEARSESKTNKTKLQPKDWGIILACTVTVMLSQSNVVKHSWNCHNESRKIYGFNLGKKQRDASGAHCFVRGVVQLSAAEKRKQHSKTLERSKSE